MSARYDTGSHAKYSCQYHIIWCPKYRYPALTPERSSMLKNIINTIANEYSYQIKALEIMPDHIHVFLSAPQTVAPVDIVRTLKSISAVKMFQQDAELKRYYARCGSLWSRGHYISTVGHISAQTVEKYILEQKNNQD